MAKKLFVGRLPFRMTDEELTELFATYGKVESATMIFDRETGRAKGFGFVEMSSDDEAKAAIDALNDKEVDGRQIVVNEARPREERPQRD